MVGDPAIIKVRLNIILSPALALMAEQFNEWNIFG